MAEVQNNSQGFITGQPQTVGQQALCTSPGVTTTATAATTTTTTGTGANRENSPPRGPRTLLLRRGENGFGFTLRHFIVYPPESCCMLPGHERTKIDEPMDTIFVKQVRANSPASEAGLRMGDRVVSVDGKPTRGEQYASVVQRIQQADPWLRLLVVSKEDDILQRYFGETAHNPETNQRPRLRSPERSTVQRQRRSVSLIPGLSSSRTRQSWVCSTLPTSLQANNDLDQPQIEALDYHRNREARKDSNKVQQQGNSAHRRQQQDGTVGYDHLEEKNRRKQQMQSGGNDTEGRYDSYERRRPDSIYSRPSSEQIYDRIKDPIYERVRRGDSPRITSEQQQQHHLALLRYPVSQAEPQVPIYRPGRRVMSRRASEGSGTASSTMISGHHHPATSSLNDDDLTGYGSLDDGLQSSDPGSRLSIDSRRDSSPNPSSVFDSSSTLTGNVNGNTNGNECLDDSVIMTRLRKSFEQKEEFLRRPSHPIGWFMPEESSESSNKLANNTAVVRREFYARPQKLQRQIWPPGGQEPTRNEISPTRRDRVKPTNQSVQRVKSDSGELDDHQGENSDYQQQIHQVVTRPERFYQEEDRSNQTKTGSKTFFGTLSKIQENISNQVGILPSVESRKCGSPVLQETRNGSVSLPPSPGPEKKNEKLLLPQGLQIVSKRAKQFESGRLLSDDDEPTGDRTNLYKSELSRLSSKRTVPNVAVRKREFESKAEAQEPRKPSGPTKESKSLESGVQLSGNRVIPIGSRQIHCEPPATIAGSHDRSKEPTVLENGDVARTRSRTRSNSAESSWDQTGSSCRSRKSVTSRYPWQQRPEEFADQKDVQDSLGQITTGSLDSATIQFRDRTEDHQDLLEKSASQDSYSPSAATRAESNDSHCANVVFRRQKNLQLGDEDRATRRVSYLKATWGERMHVDSDLDLSDSESVHASRSVHKKWKPPLFPGDVTPLRRFFEDMTQAATFGRYAHRDSTGNGADGTTGSIGSGIGIVSRDVDPVEREGPLHVKFTVLDGKRSTDRSWKQVWGVLRGPILTFYKDRHSQSPSLGIDAENMGQNVDVRCSSVDIAEDYTKRKHVLRLANPGAEVLLQTEDAASMALWLRALHEYAAAEKPSDIGCTSTSKQQAVPQTPGPMNAVPTTGSVQRLSPIPSHKGIKKLTSFRNRSPTGQSPVNKTRKPSQPIESLASPKTKTWKGRVAKQLRRMHGQAGSPSSPSGQLPPEGATFKVPLELCPPSSFSEFVPLIVEMCTSIVEARGLEVVGIYRVPGNTAAISHLTDSVNRGFENINLQDPRWSDVNVISSLLKSFFRQLPDSLLTAELYPMFIDADKVEDPQRRMTTIRKLLRDLPEHHFETLKYLMFHLKKIVEHSEVNKMEAKNLAIVFGPTLVRASGSRDNMVTMVNDMSHQCRIVESLLNNVDWFFSDEDLDDLSRLSVNLSLPADGCEVETTSSTNHNLLLNNIQKVEGTREMASARDIVSSIISAANRKIQRRRKGQDETDNENHETDKNKHHVKQQELDSLAASRRSMALNERQCSVSEIVLMHENKSQSGLNNNNNNNNSGSSGVTSGQSRGEMNGEMNNMLNDSGGSSEVENTKEASKNKPMDRSTVSSVSESSRLSSETGLSCYDASSTLSSASNETKQSNDEITIRTYAGLSATTQERIRKFEQETKAMLQRDQNRQRREAEKRDEERRRIEMEWQLAKREMENDDLLDSIVDNTVAPGFFTGSRLLEDRLVAEKSFLNLERHRNSRPATRRAAQTMAVQQEPGGIRITGNEESLGNDATKDVGASTGPVTEDSSGNVKKLKTDTESTTTTTDTQTLPPVRYGSLDSLHESHDLSRSSLSPSQQRKHLPGDISDDGSDLLTSLTTTFDRKWRSLVNTTSQSGRASTESVVTLSGNEDDDEEEEESNEQQQRVVVPADRDRNERWCTVRWL